jgi:hypothetical protein
MRVQAVVLPTPVSAPRLPVLSGLPRAWPPAQLSLNGLPAVEQMEQPVGPLQPGRALPEPVQPGPALPEPVQPGPVQPRVGQG